MPYKIVKPPSRFTVVYMPKEAQAPTPEPIPNGGIGAAREVGPLQAGVIAAGRTAQRIGAGAQDILDLANFGDPESRARRQSRAIEQAEATRLYQPLSDRHPIATAIGGAAPYLAAPTRLPGLTQQTANVVLPAALGAIEYGTPTERASRAAMAGAAGAAANLITRSIGGRAPQGKTPYEREVFDKGRKLGFTPLPSEITNSRGMQVKEAKLLADPRTSDLVENIYAQNNSRLNELAAEAIGLPKGTTQLTPDALDLAYRQTGQQFNEAAKGVQVQLGDDFLTRIIDVKDNFYKGAGRRTDRVKNTVDDLLDMANKGQLTPDEYLRQTSTLAADARSMRPQDSGAANALEELRTALDDAFDKSTDKARLPMLKDARNKWRTLLTVTDALDDTGNVSFARLSTKFKKDAFGYKRGNKESDLYDAVRFLKQFPKNFGRPGTAEARPIPSILDSTLKGAAAGAATGASLGGMAGQWGTGASIGGSLGGLLGAANHVISPMAAKLYLSPTLNRGLLPMEQGTQDILGRGLTQAGLLGLSPQFQSLP